MTDATLDSSFFWENLETKVKTIVTVIDEHICEDNITAEVFGEHYIKHNQPYWNESGMRMCEKHNQYHIYDESKTHILKSENVKNILSEYVEDLRLGRITQDKFNLIIKFVSEKVFAHIMVSKQNDFRIMRVYRNALKTKPECRFNPADEIALRLSFGEMDYTSVVNKREKSRQIKQKKIANKNRNRSAKLKVKTVVKENSVNGYSRYGRPAVPHKLLVQANEVSNELLIKYYKCYRKVPYVFEHQAVTHIKFNHKNRINFMNVYMCTECTAFHVGTAPTKTKKVSENKMVIKAKNHWNSYPNKANEFAKLFLL